jgi:hypothetical protein
MDHRPRRPDNADITVTARVRARQLRFTEVPQTRTKFTGTPGHGSASGSDRANLPGRVEEDVTYHDVWVDYWLAAALRYPAEAAGQSVSQTTDGPLACGDQEILAVTFAGARAPAGPVSLAEAVFSRHRAQPGPQ